MRSEGRKGEGMEETSEGRGEGSEVSRSEVWERGVRGDVERFLNALCLRGARGGRGEREREAKGGGDKKKKGGENRRRGNEGGDRRENMAKREEVTDKE